MISEFSKIVHETVRRIPSGKVMTYGQVAAVAGSPRSARAVGWLLRQSDSSLPWQRVVGKNGRISIINSQHPQIEQVARLRAEGVRILQREQQYYVDRTHWLRPE